MIGIANYLASLVQTILFAHATCEEAPSGSYDEACNLRRQAEKMAAQDQLFKRCITEHIPAFLRLCVRHTHPPHPPHPIPTSAPAVCHTGRTRRGSRGQKFNRQGFRLRMRGTLPTPQPSVQCFVML